MYEDMLEIAINSAKSSGQIILKNSSLAHNVKLKSKIQRDVVTEVDLQSEENIKSIICKYYPDHNIIGEEGAIINKNSDYSWYIDPLDGTVNYIHGIPLYCVTMALMYKSQVILGVTYCPMMDEVYSAIQGKGTHLNDIKVSVSKNKTINEALFIAAIPTETSSINYEKTFNQINLKSRGVLRIGSTALAMAYTASGRADGFWTYQYKPWDVAAGIILIKEAGGMVTYTDLQEASENESKEKLCVAAADSIYNDFSKIFASHFNAAMSNS